MNCEWVVLTMSRSCTSRFAAQLPEKYLAERAGFLEHADGSNHY